MTMTVERLRQGLIQHDHGLFFAGRHTPEERKFCALEFKSMMDGIELTEDPGVVGLPDLRRLNDAAWSSNEKRTEALLPVLAALWDWRTWTRRQRQEWSTHVAIEVVRQIISTLSHIGEENTARCRAVSTLEAAAAAARAAAQHAREATAEYEACMSTCAARVVATAADAAAQAADGAAPAAATAVHDATYAACYAVANAAAIGAPPTADQLLETACRIFQYVPR